MRSRFAERCLPWRWASVFPAWLCLLPGCLVTPPPEIECVETMGVGDEVTLRVRNVDDGLLWTTQNDGGSAGVFVVDGEALNEHLGVSLVDEQGRPTGVVEVLFRAETPGTATVVAEERVIGAPVGPTPPLTTVSCEIIILGYAQDPVYPPTGP